jgi:rubrerythrin
MGLLESEPEGVVRSLPELLAIANALENEAAERYRQLAQRMRSIGNKAAEQVFTHLAHEEETHAQKVTELSQAVIGTAPNSADIGWELPKDLEDEAMSDLAVSRLVTPYRALSIAVRNEDRAFAFWSYVSASAEIDRIRAYAEKMAREELRHASMLRKERRRAYHDSEIARSRTARRWSIEQLKQEAVGLETHILASCKQPAPTAAAGDQAIFDALARIGEESRNNMRALDLVAPDVKPSEEQLGPLVILDRAIAALEAAAEAYIEAADSAADEGVMLAAQQLSGSAISRLALLRENRARFAPVEFEDEP